MNIRIVPMCRKDIPAILDIENECFGAITAWTEKELIDTCKAKNVLSYVAEIDEGEQPRIITHPIGYIIIRANQRHIEIINLAVHPMYRLMSVGKQLIQKIQYKLNKNRDYISLLVSETNIDAQLFFKRLGFKATDIIRNPYENSEADGYIMQYYMIKQKQDAS